MASGCRCCPAPGPSNPVTRCYYDADPGVRSEIFTVNAGFEEPFLPTTQGNQGGGWWVVPEGLVPGWETDDTTGAIEMWRQPAVGGHLSYEGEQFAEINYVSNTRLWQRVVVPADPFPMRWGWAHRARSGTGENRAEMLLGDGTQPIATHTIVSQAIAPPNWDWVYREGTWLKPAGVTQVEVSLRSTVPAGVGYGNLVDAVSLGTFVRRASMFVCEGDEVEWRDTATGTVVDPSRFIICPRGV